MRRFTGCAFGFRRHVHILAEMILNKGLVVIREAAGQMRHRDCCATPAGSLVVAKATITAVSPIPDNRDPSAMKIQESGDLRVSPALAGSCAVLRVSPNHMTPSESGFGYH